MSAQAGLRGGQGAGRGDRPDQAGRELQLPHHGRRAPPQAGAARVPPQRHHLHQGHRAGRLRQSLPGITIFLPKLNRIFILFLVDVSQVDTLY